MCHNNKPTRRCEMCGADPDRLDETLMRCGCGCDAEFCVDCVAKLIAFACRGEASDFGIAVRPCLRDTRRIFELITRLKNPTQVVRCAKCFENIPSRGGVVVCPCCEATYCTSCTNKLVTLVRQHREIEDGAQRPGGGDCLSKAFAIAERLGVGPWSVRDAASLGKKVH